MQVYKITNLVNGKVYVGKTVRSLAARWRQHINDAKRHALPLSYAIRKYGSGSFLIEPLYTATTKEEMDAMEKHFIVLHQSHLREKGYNLTLGGDGASPGEMNPMWGKTHTDEVKAKLRALRLGTKQTEETKRKISEASCGEKNGFYGKTHVSEHALEGCRKGGFSHIGKKHSVETRMKMSQAHEGKQFSKEHRMHISQAKKGQGLGRKHSLESIERMREIKRQWWAQRKGGRDVSPLLSTL